MAFLHFYVDHRLDAIRQTLFTSILSDCLGPDEADEVCAEFEWSILRGLPEEEWQLGEAEVRAWQVAASYVLTGESASFRGVTPRNPLEPGAGTWGAFEVAARFHRLEVDDDVFSAGFASPNWYLNPFAKLVVNYEHTEFEDGGAVLGADRPDESLLLTRFQLSY